MLTSKTSSFDVYLMMNIKFNGIYINSTVTWLMQRGAPFIWILQELFCLNLARDLKNNYERRLSFQSFVLLFSGANLSKKLTTGWEGTQNSNY